MASVSPCPAAHLASTSLVSGRRGAQGKQSPYLIPHQPSQFQPRQRFLADRLIFARISEARGELRQASSRDQDGTKAGPGRFAQLEELSHVVRERILRSARDKQALQRFFRRLLRMKEAVRVSLTTSKTSQAC
jgi:hypothetical protein